MAYFVKESDMCTKNIRNISKLSQIFVSMSDHFALSDNLVIQRKNYGYRGDTRDTKNRRP